MKQIQIYVDDDLWGSLHARAIREGTSVSSLARKAVCERYVYTLEQRYADMLEAARAGKGRIDLSDIETYVRNLRKEARFKRLGIRR
jgi:hypothetical protein